MAHSAEPNLSLWPIADNQTLRYGPKRKKTILVEFHGYFISIFETALDHESEDQFGAFF
jgi:hypothetical protein